MFGFSIEKLIVIGVFAIVILGPERLPAYAARLARCVTVLRHMADGAKDRMRDELGPDFDDVDWRRLDPRQYDPRQIIRQALLDDTSLAPESRAGVNESEPEVRPAQVREDAPPP